MIVMVNQILFVCLLIFLYFTYIISLEWFYALFFFSYRNWFLFEIVKKKSAKNINWLTKPIQSRIPNLYPNFVIFYFLIILLFLFSTLCNFAERNKLSINFLFRCSHTHPPTLLSIAITLALSKLFNHLAIYQSTLRRYQYYANVCKLYVCHYKPIVW